MSSYYREQGYRSHKKLLRHLRHLVLLVLFAFILVGVYFGYDVYRQSKAGDTPSAATTPINSTITKDTQIQRTEHFQFEAPKKWRPVTTETKDGHYVYRQFNSTLVEQELVVDVNRDSPVVLPLVQVTRVLPVVIGQLGAITVESQVSDHCSKIVKKDAGRAPQFVTHEQVTFACNPDSPSYYVVVGAKGGSTSLNLKRPDGTSAIYKITYRNLSALPNSRDLVGMIESFETR